MVHLDLVEDLTDIYLHQDHLLDPKYMDYETIGTVYEFRI